MSRVAVALLLAAALGGCDYLGAQYNHDKFRFNSMVRGKEEYRIDAKGTNGETSVDSLSAASTRSNEEIKLYERYRQITRGDVGSGESGQNDGGSNPSVSQVTNKDEQAQKLGLNTEDSQIEVTWPDTVLNSINSSQTTKKSGTAENPAEVTTVTVTGPDEEHVRALSSTASISQMRDLLTEPTFPGLLPMERTIELGCLAPPDSAAFEATGKVKAAFEKGVTKAGAEAEFATAVVKMFEESERTLFLQYALFRLCEMAINAPSGFRNVYPVIIHDIVRRTAEMRDLANKEAESRRAEEEKTKQEMEKTAQGKEATARAATELAIKGQEGKNLELAAKFRRQAQVDDCIAAGTKDRTDLDSEKIIAIRKTCKDTFDPESAS